MQTFLPYPDFAESAAVLDSRRLGKQRVEAMQIIRALTRPVYGWKHHPAVLMWQEYEEALGAYSVAVCREWCRRGHADTCEVKILDDLTIAAVPVPPRNQAELRLAGALPPWLGDDAVHRSHRSALLRKDPEWYSSSFDDVPDDLPYVWPVRRAASEP
jgi:MoxR-like ATPase